MGLLQWILQSDGPFSNISQQEIPWERRPPTMHSFFTAQKRILIHNYRQNSNISRTLVGNIIVDNPDVVEASPVGAAPTAASLSTSHLA